MFGAGVAAAIVGGVKAGPTPSPTAFALQGDDRSATAAETRPIPSIHALPARVPHLVGRRNAFAFQEPRRHKATPTATTKMGVPAGTSTTTPPQDEVFPLRLIGIAASPAADRVIRIAIMSGPDHGLYLVTEGELVADSYSVTSILEAAVDLRHVHSGKQQHLRLGSGR